MSVVYFDASRLFLRGARSSPTGIDRVVFAYARWLSERRGVSLIPVWSRLGYLSRLPMRRFQELVEITSGERREAGPPPGEATWNALIGALRRPAAAGRAVRPLPRPLGREAAGVAGAVAAALAAPRALRLQPGALFVNVNHYGLEHPLLLSRLARAGVRPVVLIHDLIPLEFPEFCSPGGGPRHERRIIACLNHAWRLITNSQATATALTGFAASRGLALPICVTAPLGIEAAFLDRAGGPTGAAPYFVCVGTIEPRKNLGFLLALWRRLDERLGEATPPLVLIGRRGWENEAVVDQLERSPSVLRHVHEVAGLGDRQVASLIAGAAALLSPSFAEGYNLPVIEALALGTPVIASDIPVHRELAAGARLIDPLDGPAWMEAICAAAASRPAVDRLEPPTWRAHFGIVESALDGAVGP
jgi:glycosyltransferase involved in cell wall biosynthesis